MKSNYIAGEWIAGAGVTANINPSDLSDLIDEYAQADAGAVDQAPFRQPDAHSLRGRCPRRSSASMCWTSSAMNCCSAAPR